MKALIVSLCIACLSAIGQDRAESERLLRANIRLARLQTMSQAISKHQPIQFPGIVSVRPTVSVTATEILSDDETILRLGGVEIRTDSLIVQADELRLHWDTGEIEPVGNVRLKPIPR